MWREVLRQTHTRVESTKVRVLLAGQHPGCRKRSSPGDRAAAGCCSSPPASAAVPWPLPEQLHSPAGSDRLRRSRCRANCSSPLKRITACYSLRLEQHLKQPELHRAPPELSSELHRTPQSSMELHRSSLESS